MVVVFSKQFMGAVMSPGVLMFKQLTGHKFNRLKRQFCLLEINVQKQEAVQFFPLQVPFCSTIQRIMSLFLKFKNQIFSVLNNCHGIALIYRWTSSVDGPIHIQYVFFKNYIVTCLVSIVCLYIEINVFRFAYFDCGEREGRIIHYFIMFTFFHIGVSH